MNTPLLFKSIDAKKQNPSNKPGNFTVKFIPEMHLDPNKQHYIALDHLSMTASWHNIGPEYENNKLKITKTDGANFETITFPSSVYDYQDINDFIPEKIGKSPGDDLGLKPGDAYGINVLIDLTTYKVFIKVHKNYQIDFAGSANFYVLLGFKKEVLKDSAYGSNFPNITNSVDNIYLRCSLLSDSLVSGLTSNVLYTFSTSTKTRSLPFEVFPPVVYLWSRVYNNHISEITFYMTDDEDTEVDLNDIDISMTIVMKLCKKSLLILDGHRTTR